MGLLPFAACAREEMQPGQMFVFETLTDPKFILNVPIKRHWRGKSRMEDIESGVEAFETPLGLERVATVHWGAARKNASSAEAAIAKVYAWNDRKKRFSPRRLASRSKPFSRRCGSRLHEH